MMKKMTLILTTVLIIFCCSVDSSAAKKYVFDKSDLLSNSAIEQLEEDANLYSTSDEYRFDMVVVTTDDSEGKTATEYADDYYDNLIDKKGYSKDGILLLIAMDIREIAISTSGTCINYFDDEDVDLMIESITRDLSEGMYDDACEYFSQKCGTIVELFKNPVDSNHLDNQEQLTEADDENESKAINKEPNTDKNNQDSAKKEAPEEEQPQKYALIATACIVPAMLISGIITICKFSDEDGYYSDGNYYVKDSKLASSSIIKSDFIIEHSNDNLEYDHIYETVINEPEPEPEKVNSKEVKPKHKKTTTKAKSSSTHRTTHISSSGREHGGNSGSF